MNTHVPAPLRRLSEIVEEYDEKRKAIPRALETFEAAGRELELAVTIAGVYGNTKINTGSNYEHALERSLLVSAWKHVYAGLNIDRLASPDDKKRFEQAMEKPAPFTIDNIRATFGHYVVDPRGSILRALAEVFCSLDPAYKSHDKVKIGVKGLPKRVILSNVQSHGGYGRDKLVSILNALAAVQGKPLVEWQEISALIANEDALLVDGEIPAGKYEEARKVIGRGVRLRRFGNGNGHLYFEPKELADINRGLAEYYGDVLPDTPDENPQKRQSTAVSKDLQFYPTPLKVIESVLSDVYQIEGKKALEPSCGDGRIMDALRAAGADVFGIEVDPGRAAIARAKGHAVLIKNFLETVPTSDFDLVVMNPPFYGKHYAKHVLHALKFLKPGGRLVAILPATARYDHGLVDGEWRDLPVGSFTESGTNINTSVVTIIAASEAIDE